MNSKDQSRLFILVMFFFSSIQTHLCFAADTISSGQSLIPNQTLISKGGKYELGFFTPGTSLKYYIGIWYKNILPQTVVWVANRDTPLTDSTSIELKLLEDGNLVLFNQLKRVIWSTNTTSFAMSTAEAELGDDGNLVLRIQSNVFWQSFDHPTDTFLPGAKIRYDNITKKSVSLTSWRNSNDPARGLFTLEMDPNENQYVILWNQNRRYWNSGPWNGQIFSFVPEMRLNYIFNFSYVRNENESYFTYSLYNTSIISRLVMQFSGQIMQSSWAESTQNWFVFWSQPRQVCDVYRFCGAFGVCNQQSLPYCTCLDGFKPRSPEEWNLTDYSGGCVRKTSLLACEKKVDSFLQVYLMKWPDNQKKLRYDEQRSYIETADDCKLACLNDCSCNAYAFNNTGCLIWNETLVNQQQLLDGGDGVSIRLRIAALERPGKKPLKAYIIVLIAGSSCISILACVLFAYKMKQRGKIKYEGRETSLSDLSIAHETDQGKLELPSFDFNTVSAATNNFSNKLGQGGFGPVYKGTLLDERKIAVKRLSRSSGQGVQEFKNELMLISKLQHRNLVRLLGFCIDREEKILLYEYLPNKSLDVFLFDPTRRVLLDWSKRFNIIDGIARGLLYLHRDSRLRVIHRDLKTSNILLDEDMNPKISDFGMARIFGGKQTLANTTRVVGTYGYMSPEYAMEGIFSEKSDVFSFGVVLLEIVSSKKNNSFCLPEESYNLLGYAWRLWNENKALDLMDPTLIESYNSQELVRCIHLGLLCVQDHPLDRPTMSTIVSMLGSDTPLPIPKQPVFTLERRSFVQSGIRSNSHDAMSINFVTITVPQGR
ncbi:hypothetical protein IFM89_033890 [Coptis chinensis]|uniref:Receptor-like serine/threonine-protein kinase n=1 Tax=Coptis chinensis TaxID=261450 RepID=A0A835LFX1_9MAGN|nr:hypothetical protein IFM89_033890 [Coptis chinensis]